MFDYVVGYENYWKVFKHTSGIGNETLLNPMKALKDILWTYHTLGYFKISQFCLHFPCSEIQWKNNGFECGSSSRKNRNGAMSFFCEVVGVSYGYFSRKNRWIKLFGLFSGHLGLIPKLETHTSHSRSTPIRVIIGLTWRRGAGRVFQHKYVHFFNVCGIRAYIFTSIKCLMML